MTDTGLSEAPPAKTERQLKLAMQLLESSLWEFVLTDGRVETSYLDDGAVFWESGRASPAGTDFPSSMAALGVLPEDRPALVQAIQACVDQKTPVFRCELRLEQPDRSVRWHLVRGTVSRDDAGIVRSFSGVGSDITEVKRAEEEPRSGQSGATYTEGEYRWRSLAETLPLLVFTAAADGTIEYLGTQATEYTGRSEQDMLGAGWAESIHPDDLERTGKSWFAAIEQQHTHEVQHRIRRSDGEYRWFTTRARPARDSAGRVFKWVGTCTDVTDLKQLEEALQRTKDRLELAVRSSNLSIFEFELTDGTLENSQHTLINFWEQLGYDPTQVPASFAEAAQLVLTPEGLAHVPAEMQAYLSGKIPRFEMEHQVRHQDGSLHWRLARGVALRNEDGISVRFIGSHVDITNSKRTEHKLRESEQRWRTLVETVPHLVFTTEPSGEVDHFSAQTLAFLGRREGELLGSAWTDAIHPEDREYIGREWAKSIELQLPHETHHRVRRWDGEYRWMTTRAIPLRDDAGNVLKWFGTSTDITNMKQLEAELRHAKELLELGIRGSNVAIFDFDMPDGRIETARQTMINVWETLGYDPATAPSEFGPGAMLAIHPDDIARVQQEIGAYLAGNSENFEAEYRVRHKDGSVLWRIARGIAFRDADHKPIRFIGSFFDITDIKRVGDQLRESEERWRTLAETLPQLLWSATADGGADYLSGQCQRFCGRSEVELVGEGWLDVIHPDDRAPTAEAWSTAVQTEGLYNVEYRIRRADGVYRWFTVRGAPLRDRSGRAYKWVGACTDIEDGKQLAEKLRASEQAWQQLAEMVPHFVWTAPADGTVDYYSAQATEYTGLPERELHGFRWAQTLHPEDREHTVKAWLEALEHQQPHNVEHRVRRHDGTYQWFSTRAVPILDGAGRTVRWFGTNTNVEGFKRLEAELRHARDLLELAVRGSKVSVFDFDMPDGEIENAQQTMINLWESLGYDPLTAPTRFNPGVELAVHPDDIARVRAEIRSYLYGLDGTREDFEIEFRVRHKDGTVIWHLARGLAYRDAEGKPIRFIGTFVDITDKKEVEGQHRESEQRWRTLSEALPLLVWSANAQGVPDYFSAQTVEFTGVSMRDLCGDGWLNSVHPEDRARGSEVWLEALETQSLYQVDFRIRRADGVYRWFTSRARPVLDSLGRVSRWFGTCMDIEDGKRLAEELRASQQRWQTLAEMVPHFVWSASADGMVDYYSAQATSYTGLPESELHGIGWAQTLHPEDRDFTVKAWLEAVAQRRPHNVEHRVRKHDGSYQWLSTRAVPILDSAGRTILWVGTNTNVEGFKRLEADLRHARDLLELGVRGSKVSIFEFDMSNGELENARQTMINLWESLGYDPTTAPTTFGPGTALAIHPDDLARVRSEVHAYLNGAGQDFETEFRVRRRDGTVLWHLARGVAYRDPDGKPLRFIGSFVDITDKKQVEERHRQSEQRWQTLTETLPQLVWSANAEGAGEYFSTQAENFIGLPEAELIGAGWLNAVHPDDRAHTVDVWHEALRTESLYEVDFRIRRADGVYRWFTTRAEPLRDGAGRVFRWVGTCTDIEGGKQLAEKLRASEERWRSHAESLPQFVFTMTPDGEVDYFSATTSAYTGLAQSQLLGWGWGAAVHPDDRDRTATWLDNLAKRRGHEVEHRIRRADGAYRWFTTRAAAVLDGKGEIVAWFGTCTDIEDLKQLEADLRQAKERLELAIRSANLCIWEYDMPHGTLENSRETLTNVWESFGYDALDAPPSVTAVMHPDDIPRLNERIMACLNGDTPAFEAEYRVRYKDGSYHWLLGRGVTLRDAEGRPTRFVGTSVDINDIKRIEADLLRAREAAESANRAKDEFLANVSHEIRTPMNAILGMTELALDSARTEHQRQLLSTVRTAARNLLNIINDLLDFSKIAAGKLALDEADFSLRGALSDTVRALAPRAHRKGLELVSQVSSDVPDFLFGDAGRLRQVLMNLVGNALKFTAQGEVLVGIELESRAGNSIVLSFVVRDTGIGIARDKQAAIFRAFEQEDASTTRKYGGTGLGLTISSQLVALMGGEISVQSEPGRGSTFEFTARFALSSRADFGVDATSPKVLEHLQVLIVDDNETNRQVLVDRLTEWRMRPLAVGDAASALDALVRADARGTPFALVLLDARMPDLDGISLASEIQARFGSSSQRLILLSSDDDPVLPARSREVGIQAYLLKPVQHSELLETIWAVMNTEVLPEQNKATPTTAGESLVRRVALRILVAEDNELNVALVRELLTQSGHSAEFASDGRTALALSATNSFDLLLLDLHMPEMDGFEVVQTIREAELTTGSHLPIIALTARSSNRDRARCLAAGMDDFLSKPIEADALWAAIDRMVLAFPPAQSRPSRLIDHRALSRACGGRQAVLVKLCEVFQRSLPDHMANVRVALGQRDLHQLSRAAHKLYGTLAAFSTIAGALALTLEDLAKQEDLDSSAELVDRLEAMCSELLSDARSLVQQGHLR